jgi:hypothetical protein
VSLRYQFDQDIDATQWWPSDLLFLQDSTGSQQPYIKSAVNGINNICDSISSSVAPGGLRVGLVAFRDHPPEDNSFVTKNFGFTSNIAVMRKNLQTLVATGGGDGPEAQTAALSEALNMDWRDNAVKVVILITDAPPHGIGESSDGFPKGSPDRELRDFISMIKYLNSTTIRK